MRASQTTFSLGKFTASQAVRDKAKQAIKEMEAKRTVKVPQKEDKKKK